MNRTVSFTPVALHHAPLLHQLYQEAPGYFGLLGARVPTLGEVQSDLMTAVADPHRHLELLHDDSGELVGSVDYKTEYPEPGDLTINLLLIRESRQNEGLGQSVMQQLEQRSRHSRRILASVLGENVRGARFWERLGYRFTLDARPVMVWYAKELGAPPLQRSLALSRPA